MTRIRVIGLDWSTQESNRGVAVVEYSDASAVIVQLTACSPRKRAIDVIAEVIASAAVPCLIAIDAPLGWPVGLRTGLMAHVAGGALSVSADDMFSRDTDRFVQQMLGKRPLEVGANLIARTAHSANQFLHDLRRVTSRAIPVVWRGQDVIDCGVIEVYRAATKIASNYESATTEFRCMDIEPTFPNAHVEDAVWCAAGALHFLRGECRPPLDHEKSKREGWIWLRDDAKLRGESSTVSTPPLMRP